MAKYAYKITLGNGDTIRSDEDYDEVYDSAEEAEEEGWEALSNMDVGDEIFHLSNPGDYSYNEDDYTDATVKVIKLEDD